MTSQLKEVYIHTRLMCKGKRNHKAMLKFPNVNYIGTYPGNNLGT